MSKITSLSSSKNQQNIQDQSIHSELLRNSLQNKMKILALNLNRLYIHKISGVWEKLKLIPQRRLRLQLRMKTTVENVFRKQEYLAKWEGLVKIKKTAMASESKEILQLQQTLKKQRGTAIRLITALVVGKKRKSFLTMVGKIKQFGEEKQFKINTKYRRGIRKIIKLYNRKQQQYLNCIKTTKVIIHFVKVCKNMIRTLNQLNSRHVRWGFGGLRNELIRCRRDKIGGEIKELQQKLGSGEDEELKGLKQKQAELTSQLQSIKKQKDQIAAGFDAQVKQAQHRNKQMKQKLEQQRTKQYQMKNRVSQIDQQLKQPFSLQEIYELCYQNFLWTVSQSKDKTYSKQQVLKSLQTPLVPIDLAVEQLREENQVLSELLSEYVVMYGQKKVPQSTKIELPYQYLLKENNILYKMLMTLLPNAQFLKEQLQTIRDAFENVDDSLKSLQYK